MPGKLQEEERRCQGNFNKRKGDAREIAIRGKEMPGKFQEEERKCSV